MAVSEIPEPFRILFRFTIILIMRSQGAMFHCATEAGMPTLAWMRNPLQRGIERFQRFVGGEFPRRFLERGGRVRSGYLSL
jgi:hypothetical protein